MSRDLSNENYYVSHGERIPIKWTAPEVNIKRQFTSSGYINCEILKIVNHKV